MGVSASYAFGVAVVRDFRADALYRGDSLLDSGGGCVQYIFAAGLD